MKKGFTLIELVMVIVIIGILAAIAIPKFVDLTTEAKKSATRGGLGALRSAVAIEYAKSATSGTAAFPNVTDIDGDLFANGVVPTNELNNLSAIVGTASVPAGDSPTSAAGGWWYETDTGKMGAFSDGTVVTSAW